MTAFVKPPIMSGDYLCLVRYISNDGHFLVLIVLFYYLVTALKNDQL